MTDPLVEKAREIFFQLSRTTHDDSDSTLTFSQWIDAIATAFSEVRNETLEEAALIIKKGKLLDWQGYEILNGQKIIDGLAEAIRGAKSKEEE